MLLCPTNCVCVFACLCLCAQVQAGCAAPPREPLLVLTTSDLTHGVCCIPGLDRTALPIVRTLPRVLAVDPFQLRSFDTDGVSSDVMDAPLLEMSLVCIGAIEKRMEPRRNREALPGISWEGSYCIWRNPAVRGESKLQQSRCRQCRVGLECRLTAATDRGEIDLGGASTQSQAAGV